MQDSTWQMCRPQPVSLVRCARLSIPGTFFLEKVPVVLTGGVGLCVTVSVSSCTLSESETCTL